MSVTEPSILCILLCGDLVEHRKDLTNKGESKMWDFYEYNTGLFHTKHYCIIACIFLPFEIKSPLRLIKIIYSFKMWICGLVFSVAHTLVKRLYLETLYI